MSKTAPAGRERAALGPGRRLLWSIPLGWQLSALYIVLLARMRAILRRKGINLQSTLRVGDLTLDRLTRKVARGERQVELTPREFDLLELLLAHPRQVFSREAIVNRVWGYDFVGDSNVVDVYVRYLREKLGDEDRNLIRSVRGVGYSLEPSA